MLAAVIQLKRVIYLSIPDVTADDNMVTAFDAADVMCLAYQLFALSAEERHIIRNNNWLLHSTQMLLQVAILRDLTLYLFYLTRVKMEE